MNGQCNCFARLCNPLFRGMQLRFFHSANTASGGNGSTSLPTEKLSRAGMAIVLVTGALYFGRPRFVVVISLIPPQWLVALLAAGILAIGMRLGEVGSLIVVGASLFA